jgi:type III secretion protein J
MTRPLGLAALLLTACSTAIQHGLEERDANELVSVLVTRGVHARKAPEKGKKPTWAVEVEEEETTLALQVLTELKLPRPPRSTLRSLVQSPGLIETPAAERLRQLAGQAGDLEQALETLGGVTQASVELVVSSPPRPGQAGTPSKAAVVLRVRPEALEHLTQQRPELRALVAGGVEGLKADDVVLVLDPVTLDPALPARPAEGSRPLVLALTAGVSLASVVLVALALVLRRRREAPRTAAPTRSGREATPPPPARPMTSAVAR